MADFINGAAFKPTDWHGDGMPIIRIQNLTNPNRPPNRTRRVVNEKVRVRDGDILVSWSATLDVFMWRGEDAWLNQHIFKVDNINSAVDERYLFHLLKSEVDALRRSEHLHGSTMMHINRGPFLAHPVPVPNLATQVRIVERIDELFDQIDDGERGAAAAAGAAEILQRALSKAAVDGDLTAAFRETSNASASARSVLDQLREMQGVPRRGEKRSSNNATPLPAGWCEVCLADLLVDTLIGLDRGAKLQSKTGEGAGYVKMNNVSMDGRVDTDDVVYVPASGAEIDKYSLRDGDIIFNTRNSRELVGKAGIVVTPPAQLLFNNNLMRLRFKTLVIPEFMILQMCSPRFRRDMEDVKRATTSIAAVYGGDLLSLPVRVPPYEEQQEIVRLVFASASMPQLLASLEGAPASLRQSILAAAFRGDLVA